MSRALLSKELLILLISLLLLTAWRISVLLMQQYDLYVDEAYYWDWAQQLQWGYFSKPPMIAAVIAATTSVCGDSAFCVRSGSLLFYPLTTLVIYALANSLFQDRRLALYSALVFITLPAVSLSSLLISTDVVLFFFWALALLGFVNALKTDAWHWWLLTGVAGGLGLLSKYTMGVFAIAALLYLLASGQLKTLARPGIWVTAVIAFLIWLPNLWWNAQNEFITFSHTTEIAQTTDAGLQYDEFGEFLAGQFAVFGLVLFPLFLAALVARPKTLSKSTYRLLAIFSLSFLVIISLQALTARANANWAAPAYVAATLLTVAWLLQSGRRVLLVVAVVINLLTAGLIYYYAPLAKLAGIELNAKSDIQLRLKGWSELGSQYQALQQQHPDAALLSNRRDLLSALNYYARPDDIFFFGNRPIASNHFDIEQRLTIDSSKQRQFLWVQKPKNARSPERYFHQVETLQDLSVPIYPDFTRHYQVHLVSGFKGY